MTQGVLVALLVALLGASMPEKLPSHQNSSRRPPSEDRTLRVPQEAVKDAYLAELSAKEGTAQLDVREPQPISLRNADRKRLSTEGFLLLPKEAQGGVAPHWLIRLEHVSTHIPISIEVASDVVLGVTRADSSTSPDFDLSIFGGLEKGVSRRHAMIRPSHARLYLLDLHSTNGTCVNGLPISPGYAVEVRSEDILSLGALSFTLHIIATPAELR